MEHLNFNPLPVLQEVNRITKTGGYLYIGMPNQASLRNRLRLLRGKSIYTPISASFAQLARVGNMIVSIHWREYTLPETVMMIEKMGYEITTAYFDSFENTRTFGIKPILKTLFYTVPSFRPAQVVVGKKRQVSRCEFWLTEANS